ncbi:MAG: response regulator [Anaerolineales bacterium]|nr:response regulator [Anaerolineales bacterium]
MGQATILIVDDRPENRLLLSSQLRAGSNYAVLEAADGVQGIEVARADRPDLILLDVMMPRMNGWEVCKTLKSDPETAAIPIIMVTALRDVRDKIKGIEAGADEFLSRPHHREELLIRVRALIQLKKARERLEEERNRLKLLYDVSQATTAKLDIEQMMLEIITHTRAAVGAAKGSLILLDETGEVMHKVLIREGLSPEVADRAAREIISQGWAGWIVRHNVVDIIDDIDKDERWIQLPDDPSRATGSAIGAPINRADQVAGVLILMHPETGYFRSEHKALLETICAQLETAIENAYLYTESDQQRRKLEALYAKSNDAIVTIDDTRTISILNEAARATFGLNGEQLIGRDLNSVPQLDRLKPLFEKARGQSSVAEEIRLPSGSTLYATVTPITEVGYIAVMQDVTPLKRAEELRLAQERREKQQVKDMFSRYMGPRLVEHVLSVEPGLLARREKRKVVVMFADLRGFTRMIVDIEPNTAIGLLNEFFSNLTDIVHEFDGTIFDLAGDELMVGFNVPFDQDDATYRAILTAVTMQHRFDHLRRQWYANLDTTLGLGIGIDIGEVVVGNVGAETRMNFAMVGEAVNTSHRLVDMADDGQIVVSEHIYEAIRERSPRLLELFAFESLGPTAIKGKTKPQVLYRIHLTRTPLDEHARRIM